MITKEDIRKQALANLAALSENERCYLMQMMVKKVSRLTAWQQAKMVALTMSQGDELVTKLLIETALLQHKVVVLPRVLPKRQLSFMTIDHETTYEQHRFGMLEPVGGRVVSPTEIDFVLVPGVAFSDQGDRIGFGGGYYDRWLPYVQAVRVAATITNNLYHHPIWPVENTDQLVDQILLLDKE